MNRLVIKQIDGLWYLVDVEYGFVVDIEAGPFDTQNQAIVWWLSTLDPKPTFTLEEERQAEAMAGCL